MAWKNTAYVERQKNQITSEETRLRLSASTTRLWANPQHRARLSASIKAGASKPATQLKRAQAAQQQPRISSLNRALAMILTDFGISFEMEWANGPWLFDFYIPDHGLVLECQGEYFHQLPEHANRDKLKQEHLQATRPDLKLVSVNEIDYAAGLTRILEVLELAGVPVEHTPRLVDFRKLSISVVNFQAARAFYDAFHYLGGARGALRRGLYLGEKLIGVASFGHFQRNEQVTKYGDEAVELTRFCIHPLYQVKNLSSWFLSRCLRKLARTVVTYADTTHGHTGALYKACNFRLSHRVRADYYYETPEMARMHKKTAWERAKANHLTEADYAKRHNLTRIDGKEKLCFIYP